MNKRGAMEIVLFVFLVGLMISVALFTFFANPPSSKVNVYDARFIESLYQKQDLIEFYIKQSLENVKNSQVNFEEGFIEEFNKYNFEESYLGDFQKIIHDGNFSFYSDDEVLEIVVSDFEIKETFEKIQVKYSPRISARINLIN